MATSTETTVDLEINTVQSEEMLLQMEQDGVLKPHNIFFTPDSSSSGGGSGGGSKVIWEVWE